MTPAEAVLTLSSGAGEVYLRTAACCFLRAGAFVSLLPVLGDLLLPARLRLLAALALTAVILPAAPAPDELTLSTLFAEVGNGLILGAGFRFFLVAIQTAGTIAAQAGSLSQVFGPPGGEAQTGISSILSLAALALLCAMGLPQAAALLLLHSYEVMPQGHWPSAADISAWGLAGAVQSFRLAVSLAAPFLIAALMYNIALGAVNRAMPMLMVIWIGAPVLTFGMLVLLAASAPLLLSLWLTAVEAWILDPFRGGSDI